MFNPKENLLDQQLAVSGLEMRIAPAVALAGVSAAASIAGGIFGASSASKNNSRAKKAAKKQKKFNKKIAKKQNKHNDKLDAADKANYFAMREFNHETAMGQWQRSAELQDFQYLQSLKQYQKSQSIGNAQLGLNAQAQRQGIEAEQAALEEAFIEQQFEHESNLSALKQAYAQQNFNRQEANIQLAGIQQSKRFGAQSFQNTVDQLMEQGAMQKEAAMVESLLAEGAIQASGQAGKSTAKAQQSNAAALQRSLMALGSELNGTYRKAAIQLAELNADASLQEAGVGLNLQRIDDAIQNAEDEAYANIGVMNENMKSNIAQTERNIKQISIDRAYADINTQANMMLRPDRLSYDPAPRLPPEREFVDRMKALPGYVPPPQQQSVWAPIFQGFAGAAKAATGAINPTTGNFY
jgi:hypothetical protein|tara:strand:+ start:49 stop:1281 length:1233 start_codon:yes stop_codon:yes gene_type:complete